MTELVRFGVSIDQQLLHRFDQAIATTGYTNRSEAIRDIVRNYLVEQEWASSEGEVAGTITLLYDHHSGNLTAALNELQHQYFRQIISSIHVHLDPDNCLETVVVRGNPDELKDIAGRLISIKGVKHGRLTLSSTGKGF